MSTVEGGNLHPRSEVSHEGDTWRTIGKHPLLELKHTVEDRLLIATHINFLGLRAMLHRNNDSQILFSDTIDEPRVQGNAVGQSVLSRPPDRIMILTDKHLYVVSSPSSAIFAPAASGSCYKLSEFSRMAVIQGANSAVIQFVGGIVGVRFSSKKDCERCAAAVYTATGIPTEQLSVDDLEILHQRRSFGSSAKMSRFVTQTVRDALETQSIGGNSDTSTAITNTTGGGAGRKRLLKNDNGAVTNTVDNMLKFVLDGESELAQYDSGFPDVGIQVGCDTEEIGVDCRPETVDAATSPIDPSLLGDTSGSTAVGGLNTRSYARRFGDRGGGGRGGGGGGDSDDDGAELGDTLWNSLKNGPRRGPSASAAIGGAGRSFHNDPLSTSHNNFSFANDSMVNTKSLTSNNHNRSPKDSYHNSPGMSRVASGANNLDLNVTPNSNTRNNRGGVGGANDNFEGASAAAFDSWLGVLASYRPAMEERGITSVNRLLRIPPGAEWEAFLDEIGINRAGHRVLLTTKASAQRK